MGRVQAALCPRRPSAALPSVAKHQHACVPACLLLRSSSCHASTRGGHTYGQCTRPAWTAGACAQERDYPRPHLLRRGDQRARLRHLGGEQRVAVQAAQAQPAKQQQPEALLGVGGRVDPSWGRGQVGGGGEVAGVGDGVEWMSGWTSGERRRRTRMHANKCKTCWVVRGGG